MSSVPRIVIVDAVGDIVRIVRGALALMNRQFILVEVLSPDAALEEVANSHVDLVVTAYQLPGEEDGIVLANRVVHESLDTPVIVMAQEGDPVPETTANLPCQYFVRPTVEPFLRGLRVALDGETAAAPIVSDGVMSGVDLGPIPPVDLNPIRDVIVGLIRDVGAMGIILADRSGRVLIDEGATGYIDRETMAAVMGPMLARVADIGPLVGGRAWSMHYYNGERLDVYGLALGVHFLLGLIFEGTNRRAMAAVMLYGRKAADQIIDMIGEDAFQVGEAQAQAELEVQLPEAAREEAVDIQLPAEPVPSPADKLTSTMLEPLPDLDVDALFGQGIDESEADSLFDPDEISSLAASIDADDDERVGYDEAIDMGILDD